MVLASLLDPQWEGQMPPSMSEGAPHIDWVYYAIYYFSLFFTVVITGATLYFVYKYKRKKGDKLEPPTDEEIAAYIREWAKTDFHPAGTCKMGSDAMAVVDPDLRVRGLAGLRVIDASIMPTLVSGNTNASSIMIGEKGAAAIRGKQLAREMMPAKDAIPATA